MCPLGYGRGRVNIDRVLNVLLAIAAVLIAVVFAHREFGAKPKSRAAADPDQPPVYVANWRSLQPDAIAMGSVEAAVTVVEFADFECPFCRMFDSTMKRVQRRFPGKIRQNFVHFPLPMHRFARPAARAAECAAEQDRFTSMHDALFAKQDSFGLKPWQGYALEAGVQDTARFRRCVSSTAPVPRIEAGVRAAAALEVHATPTVIVDGWRFSRPPAESTLVEFIGELLNGRGPKTPAG